MDVAKKLFIPMKLLIKMKFSLPCSVSTKGMVISLQLQKQDNNTHSVGRRRMTGHNIVIMTDNCSFLFLLEAGAGGNNQY